MSSKPPNREDSQYLWKTFVRPQRSASSENAKTFCLPYFPSSSKVGLPVKAGSGKSIHGFPDKVATIFFNFDYHHNCNCELFMTHFLLSRFPIYCFKYLTCLRWENIFRYDVDTLVSCDNDDIVLLNLLWWLTWLVPWRRCQSLS